MDKLWVDKHRPKRLEELHYHQDVSEVLGQLATKDDFPHLLFYGPNGAGKKTRVYCFLNQVFGPGVYKLKSEEKVFKLQGGSQTVIECWTVSSNYHLEICPADNDNNDKHVVQRIIKQAASSQNIETKNNPKHFKVVVINEADRLTKEAQAALRRTMEKYISGCRVIMVCEHLNKIIAPIRSRCLNIRISAPEKDSITWALEDVAKRQTISANEGVIQSLVDNCSGNMRAAILGMQVWWNHRSQANFNVQSVKPLWRNEISAIAKDILTEQSPNKLKSVRDKLYELLVNGVDGSLILKNLVTEFQGKVGEQALLKIIHEAATHQLTMNEGSKPVYHLEAFCAHCMVAVRQQKEQQH